MKTQNELKSCLVVVYRWDAGNGGLTPDVLGASIAGFGTTIRDLLAVAKVDSPISVRVEVGKEGSIELWYVIDLLRQVPFAGWHDFFEFLKFVGELDLLEKAKAVAAVHDDLNKFFEERPFDVLLLSHLIPKMLKWAKRQKIAPTIDDKKEGSIPKTYAVGLHKLVKKGAYKKAMRPFIENQVREVEVRAADTKTSVTISTHDFGEYLAASDEVLPSYENGKVYRFAGLLVGLEKTMGEHLKFKMSQLPRPYNILISYPEDGKATTDYTDFYGKQVFINAEVIRQSMYHKPKLRLQSIELAQAPLL